jgi:hypothetical protein
MTTEIQSASSYLDLKDTETEVYDFKDMFDDDSFMKKRVCKTKFLLLKNLDPLLEKFLGEGEKVHFVSYGLLNRILEQVIGGWLTIYLNRKAMVFTSRRILFVQLKGSNRLWDLKSMLAYQSIKKVKKHLLGALTIILHSRNKYTFTNVPKSDRQYISDIVNKISAMIPEEKRDSEKERNLCPHCGVPVSGHPAQCSECGAGFKSAVKAGLLSLIFPGLGDLYLGHAGFAVLEILGGVVFWGVIVIPIMTQAGSPGEAALYPLMPLLLMHIPDSVFTFYVGRKGIYPVKAKK